MLLQILLAILLIIVTSLIFYLWRKSTYWDRLSVPNVGFFAQFYMYRGRQAQDVEVELYEKYGPIYGTYQFTSPVIVIADLNIIRKLQITEFNKFRNHSPFPSIDPRLSLNVFVLRDDYWKRMRGIMSSVFTLSKLKTMAIDSMLPCINNFMTNLASASEHGSKPLSMRKYFNCLTMDVIVSSIYGVKIDCLNDPDNEIIAQASKIFKIVTEAFSLIGLFRSVDTSCLDYLCKVTMDLVEKRHDENLKTGIKRTDFLQTVVDAKYDRQEGSKLSDDEICSFGLSFWSDGYDTTSTTMTALAYFLATNPKVQDKLEAEVQAINVSSPESVTELKYLDAVLKETIRLWPPVIFNDRYTEADYVLEEKNITIPARMSIAIPIYSLQRDSKYFKNPNSFIPERFIEGAEEWDSGFDPITIQTFGAGPRACPGQKFATLQIKLTFAKLLQKYKFVTTKDTKLENEHGPNFLVFTKDVWLQVVER